MKKLFSVLAVCLVSFAANAGDCIDVANGVSSYFGWDVSGVFHFFATY